LLLQNIILMSKKKKPFPIHRFSLLLREFLNKAEFEGIALEYQKRSGEPMPQFLNAILTNFGSEFGDPFAAMEMILRMAKKTATQIAAVEASLRRFHNTLGTRADPQRFASLLESVSKSEDAPVIRQQIKVSNMKDTRKKLKILVLSANPVTTDRLRLDEEMREIKKALDNSDFGSRFEVSIRLAVEVEELQGILIKERPDLVHFSGHGSSQSEIILENKRGEMHAVKPSALSGLFKILSQDVRCVVLNACYSKNQAKALTEHINCVIGMKGSVGDRAAIAFATAFYRGLGFGQSVQASFELGCSQVELENLKGHRKPQILSKLGVDPNTILLD